MRKEKNRDERAREKPVCEKKKRLWWIERKTYLWESATCGAWEWLRRRERAMERASMWEGERACAWEWLRERERVRESEWGILIPLFFVRI